MKFFLSTLHWQGNLHGEQQRKLASDATGKFLQRAKRYDCLDLV